MSEADVAALLRDALMITLLLGAPPLLAALVVGLVISLFQAVTQINEATLAFVPKIIATGLACLIFGGFMFGLLTDFTNGLFERIAGPVG